MTTPEVTKRAEKYLASRNLEFDSCLGVGTQGSRPPDYSPEIWADWEKMKSEDFGENWPNVKTILAEFDSFGIYIADVNPGDIKFR